MRQTASGSDPYQEIVGYYDLEHDHFRDDLALIEQLVETVGDPVLELACGSGRILEPLARAGRRLTGVDVSAAMLAAARARLNRSQSEIELIQSSITDLQLPDNRFGIILLALNGLLHATTSADQRTILAEANRCLDPRGMLYIDMANPLVSWPAAGLQPVVREGSWTAANGDRVLKFQSVVVDAGAQIVSVETWYDVLERSGGFQRAEASFDIRYIQAAELELMLELAGFVEWHIYGSYDLEPFAAESPRIIALAEKTTSR